MTDATQADGTRRFRAEREASWQALELLLLRAERKGIRALNDEELVRLPVLYRAALSSLSVARDTSLDRALVGYLDDLSARAYFFVYGVRTSLPKRALRFFTHDWPAAVRAIAREVLAAAALIAAGAVVAWFLYQQDVGWYAALMPGDLAEGRNPASSVAQLRKTLTAGGDGPLGLFATLLFTHNAQSSFLCFATGFALGVPTALLLILNGADLGAILALFASKGLGVELAAWLAIHGTTELFAIAVAGGAGFHIGRAVAFPGDYTRRESASRAGRRAATAMLGVVVMLVIAGLLEGVGRQLITATPVRFAVGGAMLTIWLAYFTFAGRARG